ncbi:GNAT family N-acetyltransferase [Xanthomonas citri]|uniref:GNAT family N-acetyltransferase n=1 Tax=Xanthomonas citri TaxID=346 RepID=UPI0012FEEEA0|nr:GNAT family N-acetyltransferase [Xanthomonas citri]
MTSDIGDVDIADLVRFSELAWRHNYKGRLRVVYDAPFYAWLLSGKDWFAVLARNGEGRIVGCMFALVRDLYIRGEAFPSVYSTGWAVDPAYRRTGVSLRLWLALHDRVREGGYVSIGASHAGLSGTRGDVVFRDDAEDRGRNVVHHCGAIWSRRSVARPSRTRRSPCNGFASSTASTRWNTPTCPSILRRFPRRWLRPDGSPSRRHGTSATSISTAS